MKKLWNFTTKTIGTIVILFMAFCTILGIVDYFMKKHYNKSVETCEDFDDDLDDFFEEDLD